MAKQRQTKGRFVGIPYNVANSQQFAALSYRAKALLLDLLLQYNGRNNGSLSACHTLMKNRGAESEPSSIIKRVGLPRLCSGYPPRLEAKRQANAISSYLERH